MVEGHPLKPASVDDGAEYVEPKDEWHQGQADGETQHKVGRWRLWTREGQLKQDVVYVDDVRHGPATLFVQGGNPFTDARIAHEKGEFREGRRAGRWLLCDAKGTTLGTCDYGDTGSLEGGPLAAFSNDSTLDYAALAKKLEGEGHLVEALVTWARVAGLKRDTAGFNLLLARIARPVKEEVALTLAMEAERPTNWLGYELVEGAHPAMLLNKLARALHHRPRTALRSRHRFPAGLSRARRAHSLGRSLLHRRSQLVERHLVRAGKGNEAGTRERRRDQPRQRAGDLLPAGGMTTPPARARAPARGGASGRRAAQPRTPRAPGRRAARPSLLSSPWCRWLEKSRCRASRA